MTLKTRLLVAALLLSLAITTALALIVRGSWQRAEADRFQSEFQAAVSELETTLRSSSQRLADELAPLCKHDPLVDSALVGLVSGTLPERTLSLRARVPELESALGLDALLLVTHEGTVLAGSSPRARLSPETLVALTELRARSPSIRLEHSLAFEAACLKREGRSWVGLLGSMELGPLLSAAGKSHNLDLQVRPVDAASVEPVDPATMLGEEMRFDFLPGAAIRAERSRLPLRGALKDLDVEIFSAAAGTLIGAFLLALLLSRGLARPVIQFAERARLAVQGNVEALPIAGGPELEQAARAFNATLSDLVALRERLRLTEKIAARREVARQLAHEIKNPLSPIRTSIETLVKLKQRGHPEFDAYFNETTSTVLSEVGRINNLVSHFAEYARLPSPVTAAVDLGALVSHMVHLHRDLGATLDLEVRPTPTARLDRDQIAQVVTNLIKNALEATATRPDARIRILVGPDPTSPGARLEVRVSDNGPGLRPGEETRIFEPYVTTKAAGSGLGLPISHRIAIEHGGDLTYIAPAEGGALFLLTVPVSGPPVLKELAE